MYAIFNGTFRSFKALQKSQRFMTLIEEHNQKSPDKIDEEAVLQQHDKQEILPMLHYWTVFAFIQFYDYYFEELFTWIPFYHLGKGIILFWVIAEQTRGATVFFENFLTPQIEKRMVFFETFLFPLICNLLLSAVVWLQSIVLRYSITSISTPELIELDQTFDRLVRLVTREGYLRRREESIQALQDAVPDERQRVALLDDILKEFTVDTKNDSEWTELRLAHDDNGLRLRFGSEFETEEETYEFQFQEEATIDNVI